MIVINEKNKLERRKIEPIWQDEKNVVLDIGMTERAPEIPGDPRVQVGLEAGELVCVTPIPFAASGVSVTPYVKGEALPVAREGGKGPGKGGKGRGEGRGKGEVGGNRPKPDGERNRPGENSGAANQEAS